MDEGCGEVDGFFRLCYDMVSISFRERDGLVREGLTRLAMQGACTQEQEVDSFLLFLELDADIVYVTQQARVFLQIDVCSVCVQLLAFCYDPVGGFLRAANKIDLGLGGGFGKLLEGILSDTACAAYKDSGKAWRESRSYAGVGSLYIFEGDHGR